MSASAVRHAAAAEEGAVKSEALLFSKDHFWFKIEKHKVIMGLTNFGLNVYGGKFRLMYPEIGRNIFQNMAFTRSISKKGYLMVDIPFSGKVINNNYKLRQEPALLAKDPYGEGWLMKLEWQPPYDKNHVMEAEQYWKFIKIVPKSKEKKP